MPIDNLFTTRIGSHIWRMDHVQSDIDLFKVYVVSTEDLLKGTAVVKSEHRKLNSPGGTKIDCHVHEIGTLVNQILKGNINFVIGVISPWIEKTDYPEILSDLKQLTEKNVGKSIFHSINGLAISNYKKYISSGKNTSPKKCATIFRTLKFGIKYLETGKFKFEPVESSAPEDIVKGIEALNKAFSQSNLLSVPNETPFRDWLLNVRMFEWNENDRTL